LYELFTGRLISTALQVIASSIDFPLLLSVTILFKGATRDFLNQDRESQLITDFKKSHARLTSSISCRLYFDADTHWEKIRGALKAEGDHADLFQSIAAVEASMNQLVIDWEPSQVTRGDDRMIILQIRRLELISQIVNLS